jgi:hypothetical protein
MGHFFNVLVVVTILGTFFNVLVVASILGTYVVSRHMTTTNSSSSLPLQSLHCSLSLKK